MFSKYDHLKQLNMKVAGTLPKTEKKIDPLEGKTGKARRNAKKKEQKRRKKLGMSQTNISNCNTTNDGKSSKLEDEDEAPDDIEIDGVTINCAVGKTAKAED